MEELKSLFKLVYSQGAADSILYKPEAIEQKFNEIWGIVKNTIVVKNIAVLDGVVGRSEQLVCDECGYPMFYYKPDDIMYCHGCDNTKPAN